MTSLHVYGTSVLTSITSQNTLGVNGIHTLPTEFVGKQINAVLSDIGTDAVKTGMLATIDIINVVVDSVSQYPDAIKHLVVDPVMISTSGSELLTPLAVDTMKKKLFPLTYLLTPNVPEAEFLLGQEKGSIKTLDDVYKAAKELAKMGPSYVLLKGGHLPQVRDGITLMIDVLYDKSTDTYEEVVNPPDVLYLRRLRPALLRRWTVRSLPCVHAQNLPYSQMFHCSQGSCKNRYFICGSRFGQFHWYYRKWFWSFEPFS
jgi:hydroxymethylpyrimidine/phosphomethylpyrimidine kinase